MEPFELTPDPAVFQKLCELIETLRGPDGCPWDRQQSPQGTMGFLIEEVYELADAVADNDAAAVCEELGDVLFLVLFLVQLYREKNHFGLNTVSRGVHAKMVRRHPHVFAGQKVTDSAEVSRNWARIKQTEKPDSASASVMDAIPRATPALMRAYRVSAAVADAGLDPRTVEDIWPRIDAAMAACKQALQPSSPDTRHSAYGDLLWALVALGRIAGIQPDAALCDSVDRFEGRFRELEEALGDGRQAADVFSADERARIERLF